MTLKLVIQHERVVVDACGRVKLDRGSVSKAHLTLNVHNLHGDQYIRYCAGLILKLRALYLRWLHVFPKSIERIYHLSISTIFSHLMTRKSHQLLRQI